MSEDKNLISDCGCRFKCDAGNTVLLCEKCSELPCHTGDINAENVTLYCECCCEEYWLPEDTEHCPFCGGDLRL